MLGAQKRGVMRFHLRLSFSKTVQADGVRIIYQNKKRLRPLKNSDIQTVYDLAVMSLFLEDLQDVRYAQCKAFTYMA